MSVRIVELPTIRTSAQMIAQVGVQNTRSFENALQPPLIILWGIF